MVPTYPEKTDVWEGLISSSRAEALITLIEREILSCVVTGADGPSTRMGDGAKPPLPRDGMKGRKRRRRVSAIDADVDTVRGSVDEADDAGRRLVGRMNVTDEERTDGRNERAGALESCRDNCIGADPRFEDQTGWDMPCVVVN